MPIGKEVKDAVQAAIIGKLGESEADLKFEMNVANLVGSTVLTSVTTAHSSMVKLGLAGEKQLVDVGYNPQGPRVKRFVQQQEQFGELFLKLGNNIVS